MTTQPPAHLARPPYKEPPTHAPNAALLIDFDNVTMGIRSDLQTELKRLLSSDLIKGKVAVQRAYADWRRYPQYVAPLTASSIDMIWAPAYGATKKNATDIRLAVDALELVFTRPEIGTFILLSGDSDFSSLVIKLKEYGKYVIGVGIRESSSDLLIQNCDEYFSYNELAGLTKESDISYVRHDPWELVVEATKQMTAHNDVMRSDRLKQVMQEIDPSFDEKDVGFSRFSKFVQEAAHRGLIATARLDNGQYEISLGQRTGEAAATPGVRSTETAPAVAPEAAPAPRRGSLVGDAFGLLKQALGRLGGEQEVSVETVREAMNELAPEGTRRVDSRSMPKLLRQAHDADLIDLSRDEGGAYSVRVRPEDEARPAAAATPPREPREEDVEENEPPMPTSSAPPPPYSQPGTPLGGVPARGGRFRRGSRGPRPASPGVPRVGVVEVDPTFRPRTEPVPSRPAPPGGSDSSGRGHDDDERPRRERGGRGRGGRGRGGRGREGGEGGEGGGGGERSPRGRRGGRGRGGRGERNGGLRERGEPLASHRPPVETPVSAPPSQPVRPPQPPQPSNPHDKDEGDSFWSRVKRGLIGGE
jgi:uncharacterized protein (TIGR00288 family)